MHPQVLGFIAASRGSILPDGGSMTETGAPGALKVHAVCLDRAHADRHG